MLRIMVLLLLWPFAAMADGGPALTGPMHDRIIEDPQRFEVFVAGLILGYGHGQGLSAGGVEDYLAVERAKIRVRELRRLLLADLDDDGRVTEAELFVVMAATGSTARGSLWQSHSAADSNGDGIATSEEMRSHARKIAARAGAEEAAVRGVMQLDFDANGFVTLAELRKAVALIAPET